MTAAVDPSAAETTADFVGEDLVEAAADSTEVLVEAEEDEALTLDIHSTLNLLDVARFSFGKRPSEGDGTSTTWSVLSERERRIKRFDEEGMRRSVAAILVVQSHRFPRLLLLQEKGRGKRFLLPGGRLKPGESDVDGLKRKLSSKLSAEGESGVDRWEIGDRAATWWAPDFRDRMYPYCPAHVSTPKERLSLYVVSLMEPRTFSVSHEFELLAVPLFEVYSNAVRVFISFMQLTIPWNLTLLLASPCQARYGPIIASVPAVISRYRFNYL